MAINDKLNRIKEIKEDIKQALIDKGVEVTDEDSFGSYADKITNIPMEGGDPYYEELYNLRTNNGTDMAGLFAYATGDNLDLTKLDVSKCTSMRYMFSYCNVKDIDCSGWDVGRVTDMDYMFEQCTSNVNTTGWDTSKCTSLYHLFEYFRGRIDISNWDMSNVTLIENGFYNANLTNIKGISELKMPKVTSLGSLFSSSECDTLDLSSWNTDNITDMYSTFSSAKIRKIDLSNWNTSKVTNMGYMFNTYSSYLEELIIPDWDMTNVTSKSSFFPSGSSYTKNLKYIDLSRSNEYTVNLFVTTYLPKRTESTYGNVAIPADSSQEVIDACIAKYWKPIGPALIPTSFEIASELDEVLLNKSTKVHYGNLNPWYSSAGEVEFISSDETIASINEQGEVTAHALGNVEIYARLKDNPNVISNTISISVSEIDSYPNVIKFRGTTTPTADHYITVNGTNVKLTAMDYNDKTGIYTYDVGQPITKIQFNGPLNSSYINILTELIKLNTSNITSMEKMFYYTDIVSLDVSNWDVSNVTNMDWMFAYCPSLTSLDLSSWDTSNVTRMMGIFDNCPSLITVGGLSDLDTSSVTKMNYMFTDCSSLTSLDLSSWDTSSVEDISYIFEGCKSLASLDLSSWDTSSVRSKWDVFLSVPSTCQIYVGPNWTLTETDTKFAGTFIRV